MLNWIPIPSKVRRFFGRNLRRFANWREQRQRRRDIEKNAAPAIKKLRSLKKSLPVSQPFIGILLVEHIGDIIACEPVINWLRRKQPDAFIVWVIKDSYKELLANHSGLDAVIAVKSLAQAAPIICSKVFDTFVDLHVSHKPTGVPGLDHIKHWGNPSIDAVNYLDHGSILSAFSSGAGLPPLSGAPRLYISEAAVKQVDSLKLPASFIVIHTSSNEKAKDWPFCEWSKLVQFLIEVPAANVIELGLNQTLKIEHAQFQSLCGRLSLLETAEVIRRASFFIGIDSGLAHMANALERPGLVLFSRYRGQDSFLPYNGFFADHADEMILRHPNSLDDLSASQVIDKLKRSSSWSLISKHHNAALKIKAA